jgi:hypothetical protein
VPLVGDRAEAGFGLRVEGDVHVAGAPWGSPDVFRARSGVGFVKAYSRRCQASLEMSPSLARVAWGREAANF